MVKSRFPEWSQVLAASGGRKPIKFVEAIRVKVTPTTFNPSEQGDFAYTSSFLWDGKQLTKGVSYSYDSMTTFGINPYERIVDVPLGKRMWVVTYDGQMGGYWSQVSVFVNPGDFALLPEPLKVLKTEDK